MTNMAPTLFARIQCRIEHKSEAASDICLAMAGDSATDPTAPELEPS